MNFTVFIKELNVVTLILRWWRVVVARISLQGWWLNNQRAYRKLLGFRRLDVREVINFFLFTPNYCDPINMSNSWCQWTAFGMSRPMLQDTICNQSWWTYFLPFISIMPPTLHATNPTNGVLLKRRSSYCRRIASARIPAMSKVWVARTVFALRGQRHAHSWSQKEILRLEMLGLAVIHTNVDYRRGWDSGWSSSNL